MTHRKSIGYLAFTTALLLATLTQVRAADVAAGKTAFRQQCALCHTAEPGDNGGAQGPGLHGIYGKRAASNPAFTYTAALRSSNLVWDGSTLERFLASPTAVVPGSSMVIPVAQKSDRENIVAYLQSVAGSVAASSAPAGLGEADWKKDAPGRVHHIKASELPAPFDTPSARNFRSSSSALQRRSCRSRRDSRRRCSLVICKALVRCASHRTAMCSYPKRKPAA